MVPRAHKLSLAALTALVVGSILDAGIFSVPATFGRATGALGATIAWIIAGVGMLMLALLFQKLSWRKPTLKAGIFDYVREGFGEYAAFFAVFGFWASCCVGSVSYFLLIKSTFSRAFPALGEGNTPLAVALSSVGIWFVHYLVLHGIRQATVINTLATVAKVLIVVIFIFFVAGAFEPEMFRLNFWGGPLPPPPADVDSLDLYGRTGHAAWLMRAQGPDGLLEQVRRTMLVAAYVFIGVEGASIYARYARRRKDVGLATLMGFFIVLFLFILVTLISYGVMERQSLAALRQPSLAGILEYLDRWRGGLFVRAGLVVTVLGAYLAWVLLAMEALYAAAQRGGMPRFMCRVNRNRVPHLALLATSGLVQFFLLCTLFSGYAYGFALELTSALSRMPYLFVAGFALKLALSGETYALHNKRMRVRDAAIACVAIVYLFVVLWAGGTKYILLSALVYAPGSVLYVMARREQGVLRLPVREMVLIAVVWLTAAAAVVSLSLGYITI